MGQLPDHFHGDHGAPGDQLGQHRRPVARTGADFQDLIIWLQAQRLGDQGHDVGLGDGLAISDGEGHVQVGHVAVFSGHEGLTGDQLHGIQHLFGLDAPLQRGE